MNKLTVIITFLNEGYEVENTIKSVRETAGDSVDIVLINDCSSDKYDYLSVSLRYNTVYVINKTRMGVAKSREIGVSIIKTPFFILLDAHMRFYTKNWHELLVEHLNNNDRALYCFSCKSIDQFGNTTNSLIADGAKLSIYGNDFTSILNPQWITTNDVQHEETECDVPCVLGASYAMSKYYWDYIKGLSLLKYYGTDEAYLSLKVWLEGGRCVVIRGVVVGHIFRYDTSLPYNIYWSHFFFNKLIISETMLPQDYNKYVHSMLLNINKDAYISAYALLLKENRNIMALRSYYSAIFTRNFDFFKEFNGKYIDRNQIPIIEVDNYGGVYKIMKMIYDYLCKNRTCTIGLGVGGLGEIIFMSEYANSYDKKELVNVKTIVAELLEQSKINNFSFEIGMSGLAIGLKCLNKYFEEYDIDNLFKDFDDKIVSSFDKKINECDFSISTGAIGVALYFLERDDDRLRRCVNTLLLYINAYVYQTNGDISKSLLFEIAYFLIVLERKGICTTDSVKQIENALVKKELNFIDQCMLIYFLVCANKDSLSMENEKVLKELASRRDADLLDVLNIGIYEGTSSLVFIFNQMYEITGDVIFKEAMIYWRQETLFKMVSIVENNVNVNALGKSYLYGITGAALTVLNSMKE